MNTSMDEVMKCPTTPEEWRVISDKFARRGGTFPIHGVHLMASSSTASVLQTVVPHNYKGFYSVVLMSLVDADYKSAVLDQHQTFKSAMHQS